MEEIEQLLAMVQGNGFDFAQLQELLNSENQPAPMFDEAFSMGLITQSDLDTVAFYTSQNRSVTEYIALSEQALAFSQTISEPDANVVLDFVEIALQANESALPRADEYTALTDIALNIPLRALDMLPALSEEVAGSIQFYRTYLDMELIELQEYFAGGSYTFITKDEFDQLTNNALDLEGSEQLFSVVQMLNQEEGPGLGGFSLEDLQNTNPEDLGQLVSTIPFGELQAARSEFVQQIRPEDGTGETYFDIAEFSNGFDIAREVFKQVESSSIEGSPQDMLAKFYLEMDSSAFSAM